MPYIILYIIYPFTGPCLICRGSDGQGPLLREVTRRASKLQGGASSGAKVAAGGAMGRLCLLRSVRTACCML